MRLLLWLSIISAALLPLAGCGAAAGGLPEPQPPKVSIAAPLERDVRDIDEYTGRVEARETVEVRARVSGYLQEVYFQDGDYVEKGQPLFLIDPRTYQAEYDQALARINLNNAKYIYAKSVRVRNEKLVANKSVPQEEYEQSVASENEALAALESAKADAETNRLNLEFTHVNAEIAGRIDRTYVTKGNLVQSGPTATLLTKIVSVDPVYVYFNPDELAFLRYSRRRLENEGTREAQPVRERHIEATIVLADGSTYPETGTIDFSSNTVDPSTGTIQVRAVFPNPRRALTPGLFVRLHVAAESAYHALLVPERAIGTDQSDKFVYIVDDKNIAQRRNVQLGTKHGRLRVITSGIQPLQRIIVSGSLLVRPGQPVQPTEVKIDDDSETTAVTQLRPNTSPPPAPSLTPSTSTPPPSTSAPQPSRPHPFPQHPVER